MCTYSLVTVTACCGEIAIFIFTAKWTPTWQQLHTGTHETEYTLHILKDSDSEMGQQGLLSSCRKSSSQHCMDFSCEGSRSLCTIYTLVHEIPTGGKWSALLPLKFLYSYHFKDNPLQNILLLSLCK